MRLCISAIAMLALSAVPAFACPSHQYEQCYGGEPFRFCLCHDEIDVPKIPKPNPIDVLAPGFSIFIKAAQDSGNPVLAGAAQNVSQVAGKLDVELKGAIATALTNPAEGVKNLVETHIKAANDIADSVHATARFAERSINGYGDVLSNAQKRLREGKVVDAIWHIGTDQFTIQNDNAAKLMQESEVIRTAAQAAITAQAGPAGSAAFAAWLAYNASGGNVEAALRVGAYSYIMNSANAQVGSWPEGAITDSAKKAAASAAMKGIAVAAAGGSEADIRNAALQGASSVIVQSGQAYVTKKFVDPSRARADAFCMDAIQGACEEAAKWKDVAQQRYKEYQQAKEAIPSSIATPDGQWVISWDKKALVDRENTAPSIALTYVGKGSPYQQEILAVAAAGNPKFSVSKPSYNSWVAYRNICRIEGRNICKKGRPDILFERFSKHQDNSLSPGDFLKASIDVNVRPGPAGGGWGDPIDYVPKGAMIRVLEVRISNTDLGPQEWVRFEPVKVGDVIPIHILRGTPSP